MLFKSNKPYKKDELSEDFYNTLYALPSAVLKSSKLTYDLDYIYNLSLSFTDFIACAVPI